MLENKLSKKTSNDTSSHSLVSNLKTNYDGILNLKIIIVDDGDIDKGKDMVRRYREIADMMIKSLVFSIAKIYSYFTSQRRT